MQLLAELSTLIRLFINLEVYPPLLPSLFFAGVKHIFPIRGVIEIFFVIMVLF